MITVIIVVYNAAKYLELALNSVFNQTYRDLEIIAVDDGSTDDTVRILNKYINYPNFKLLKRNHTKNLGGNRNDAIKLAKGEIIAFIDGDDIWEIDKLAKQIEFIDKYDMICSNASLINSKSEVIEERYYKRYKSNSEIELSDLIADNFVRVSTVIIKKSAIEKAGYFEDGPDTRAEDYILWLNYLKFNKILFVNESLVKYRIHEKNWSNSRPEDWERLLLRTIDIRSYYMNSPNEKVKKSAKVGCAMLYLELVKFEVKKNRFKKAKQYMKSFLKFYENRFSVKYMKYLSGYLYISVFSTLRRN